MSSYEHYLFTLNSIKWSQSRLIKQLGLSRSIAQKWKQKNEVPAYVTEYLRVVRLVRLASQGL